MDDTKHRTSPTSESLPDLVRRLGPELVTLLETKLSLLKVEIKEAVKDEVKAYARHALVLAVGALMTLVGFLFLNISLALLVSTFFQGERLTPLARCSLGFLVVALAYLLIGALIITRGKKRIVGIAAADRKEGETDRGK